MQVSGSLVDIVDTPLIVCRLGLFSGGAGDTHSSL